MLVHAILSASRANGLGLRAVVFVQGCQLGCPGCFNPETHLFRGTEIPEAKVVEVLIRAHGEHGIEGVTFSGGEPMQQADSLVALIKGLRREAPTLSFGMFSGYTERELDEGRYSIWGRRIAAKEKRTLWDAIRALLDFAVLGRFNQLQPGSAPLRSSRNQVLRLFSGRYLEADFARPATEVLIHETGWAELTGFPILGLPW